MSSFVRGVRGIDADTGNRDEWQPGMAIVDFTYPAACKWYAGLIHKLMDQGVDTIKTDFGERIPHLDVVYHDGSDPRSVFYISSQRGYGY